MIITIIDQGLGRESNGPVVQAMGLLTALNKVNCDIEIKAVSTAYKIDSKNDFQKYSISSFRYALKLLYQRDSNIVHWNYVPYNPVTIMLIYMLKVSGIPQVVTIHGDLPWTESRYTSRLRRFFEPLLYPLYLRVFSKVIFPSKCIKEILMKKIRLQEKQTAVIYNSISDDLLSKSEATPGGSYILCVANNDPIKNVDTLIRAYGTYKKEGGRLPLIIVGKGYEKIKKGIGHIDGLNFVGPIDNNNLAPYYKNCKALVLPSLHETFGLPIVEAMAYGKPVFACNRYAIPEVTGNFGTYISDCNSAKSWARVFFSIEIAKEDTIEKYEARRRYVLSRYTWPINVRKFLNIYQEVIKGEQFTA